MFDYVVVFPHCYKSIQDHGHTLMWLILTLDWFIQYIFVIIMAAIVHLH